MLNFLHNTPFPYNFSSENIIIAAHELAHALHNPSPKASFYIIGDSQMVAIDQLSDIFPKVAANLHQPFEPPQKQPITKCAPLPHQVHPARTKHIPAERPNIIEYDDGKGNTYLHRDVYKSHSGPQIILSDVLASPQTVCPAQPPRVDTGGPSSNLRSSCNKNTVPNYALTAKNLQIVDANAVTHPISVG